MTLRFSPSAACDVEAIAALLGLESCQLTLHVTREESLVEAKVKTLGKRTSQSSEAPRALAKKLNRWCFS